MHLMYHLVASYYLVQQPCIILLAISSSSLLFNMLDGIVRVIKDSNAFVNSLHNSHQLSELCVGNQRFLGYYEPKEVFTLREKPEKIM